MRAVITGTGRFIPEKKLSNHDIEKMLDTNDEWITTRTGIKERRILEKNRGTSFMAVKAAEMTLEKAGVSADEIDLIILSTVTPDMTIPSAAAIVQKELEASNCWGFDLNGGCTGFVYALVCASQFIESGRHKKVLVIGADKMSSILDYKNRNTCVLFGDGAGAVLLEASETDDTGIEDFELHLDGSGSEFLKVPAGGSLLPASNETVEKGLHYVYQDGKSVFKRAVRDMAKVSASILEKNGLSGEDIHMLIPHQANIRIIDAVSKKLNLTHEQVFININKYGNTTSATIPIAISEAFEQNRLKPGDRILMSAFGAGFTWGSLLLKWTI
ncbi:beta-ketoacyl-ACP synthase III [Desulfobacterales bacterium HSG16]|nr:beta-ketoacyl-ACP synthase III [Desulfobacterales bacterium HSG16]